MNARFFVSCVSLFASFLMILGDSLKYQPGPYQGTDVWLSSYYDYNSNFGVDDQYLRVGGWGDEYMSAIRFDLDGLPKKVEKVTLRFYNENLTGGSRPVSIDMFELVHNWDESFGYYTTEWSGYSIGSINAPEMGNWYSIDITDSYRRWKRGIRSNFGLMFTPKSNNNEFNYFRSSDYKTKRYRPSLEITPRKTNFQPIKLKLPLPGGRKWCLTTEIGGKDEYFSDPNHEFHIDKFHTGKTYFFLDFSPSSKPAFVGDIPIYAAESGRVISTKIKHDYNGYHVIISHDNDYLETTGYTTKYIHLKYPPKIDYGQKVKQGDLIGYMGNTGRSDGTHLHFGLYFEGKGNSDIEELCIATLEGMPLKNYLTEIEIKDKKTNRVDNSYYPSTNTR